MKCATIPKLKLFRELNIAVVTGTKGLLKVKEKLQEPFPQMQLHRSEENYTYLTLQGLEVIRVTPQCADIEHRLHQHMVHIQAQ